MVLSKKKKEQAEQIAKANFDHAGTFYRRDADNHKRLAKEWTKQDIEALKDGFGKQYGSVFTTILISLMLKFAMRLIERWIEKKINDLLD